MTEFSIYRDLTTGQLYFGTVKDRDVEIYNWDNSKTIVPHYMSNLIDKVSPVNFQDTTIYALCRATEKLGVSLPFFLRKCITSKMTKQSIIANLGIVLATLDTLWKCFDLHDAWKDASSKKRTSYRSNYMGIVK